MLVPGDLGGGNVHFGADGKLTGVLDWDLASPADPAIDAALVATWHGRAVLRAAADDETNRRAWTWNDPIGVEHLHAVFAGQPLTSVDGFVRAVVAWLEARGHQLPRNFLEDFWPRCRIGSAVFVAVLKPPATGGAEAKEPRS